MWPFRKKQVLPTPEDVVLGTDRAWFLPSMNQWMFEVDGTEFTLSGREFDTRAFSWAREALGSIQALGSEIDRRVLQAIDGWPCDASARHLFSVGLDEYASEARIHLMYFGDDTWGDYGVDVILCGGEIIDAYGGD